MKLTDRELIALVERANGIVRAARIPPLSEGPVTAACFRVLVAIAESESPRRY